MSVKFLNPQATLAHEPFLCHLVQLCKTHPKDVHDFLEQIMARHEKGSTIPECVMYLAGYLNGVAAAARNTRAELLADMEVRMEKHEWMKKGRLNVYTMEKYYAPTLSTEGD